MTFVTDWHGQADALARAACGVIEVADERLVGVRLRRLARRPSWLECLLWGRVAHERRSGNRCWLYYHQPRRFSNFLALDYVISARDTTLATFRGALCLLDELARLKRTDAIVCDVATTRISDRLLARWGWAPHSPSRWHRHFIKRFYGHYPPADPLVDRLLASSMIAPSLAQLALCR
jgi:hypothetical protein